jgi:type IV pilus assembly protein PilZ
MEERKIPKERRAYPRKPIELKVEYKRLNTFFADYTKNISKGGTFIKTTNPLEIGTEFIFKLFVPTLEQPLHLKGRVQWIVNESELKEGRYPGMGIKFMFDSEEERKQLHSRVENLMIKSLGYHLSSKLLHKS